MKIDYSSYEKIGLFSGGKDSLVACLVAGVKEVIYCRTGVGLNEEYVKRTCDKFGWKLNIIEPKPNTFENFVKTYTFPKPTSHSWIMRKLKLHPLDKWYRKESKKRDIILISGVRSGESRRRKRNTRNMTNETIEINNNMKFLKPILDWSNNKVEDYIKENDLEISPIYKTIGIGGDCLCGAFSKRQHGILLLKYHPELAKKISDLELKYNCKWGQWMSLTACEKQGGIEDYICSECMVQE